MKKFIGLKGETRELFDSPSILLRKKFDLSKGTAHYILKVCGLGFGVYYINGTAITNDVFLTPISDYRKTLWYTEYDVTHLLSDGENVICAELGNGFYNENFESVWGHYKAEWRGEPCLWLEVYADNEKVLGVDESWQARESFATIYNQLRSGEYFDSRKQEDWTKIDYDEKNWENAVWAEKQPQGELKLCDCPPIREFERYSPIAILKNQNGYVFDFGVNMSGYAEIDICAPAGTEIILSYAEEIDENNLLKLNGCGCFYPSVPFQTDKIICNGKRVVWKPRFTYHGFRYVEVAGLKETPDKKLLTAIFTHQDLERISKFSCSDDTLNKIWEAGIRSTYSNTFYSLTDCPTREKLSWLNDAAASLKQLLLNFDCSTFLQKWYVDIVDAMDKENNLPGIAPSPDWGYWHGVVTNGIIISLPYMLRKYTGDTQVLQDCLPYMERYHAYHLAHLGKSALGDWTGARNLSTPALFIDQIFELAFLEIFICAYPLGSEKREKYLRMAATLREEMSKEYLLDGRCIIEEQSSVSAMIVMGIGDEKTLGQQLVELVEKADRHIACGMFGIQFLYQALLKIGEGELWLDMILNESAPSFKAWIDSGATTLYETFDETASTFSRNHHMFSNVIGHFIEDILGIKVLDSERYEYEIVPAKLERLTFAKGEIKLPYAKDSGVFVDWEKTGNGKEITVRAVGKAVVIYRGERIVNMQKRYFEV